MTEADVMERARGIWDKAGALSWEGSTGHYHSLVEAVVAQEIQEYGDRRAREARATAIEEAAQEALTRDDGVYDEVQRTYLALFCAGFLLTEAYIRRRKR